MFDPDTGLARVVADGVIEPNGIAFNPTGKIAYVYEQISSLLKDITFDVLISGATRHPCKIPRSLRQCKTKFP